MKKILVFISAMITLALTCITAFADAAMPESGNLNGLSGNNAPVIITVCAVLVAAAVFAVIIIVRKKKEKKKSKESQDD